MVVAPSRRGGRRQRPVQLAHAEPELRRRTNRRWLVKGVTMVDPGPTYIDVTVAARPRTSPSSPARSCRVDGRRRGTEVGPDTRLVDCIVGEDAVPYRVGPTPRSERARSSDPTPCSPGASRAGGPSTGSFYTASGLNGCRRREGSSGKGHHQAARALLGHTHPSSPRTSPRHLDVELGDPNLVKFPNGESDCRFSESFRGADVFVIQSHCDTSVNDSVMEHLVMLDATKRASAKRITAVVPVLRVRPPGPQGRGS